MKGKHVFSRVLDRTSPHLKKILLFPYYLDYRRWEKQKKVSFLINICIGIILGIVFFYTLRLQYMENMFNSTMDKYLIKREATEFMKISKCRMHSSQSAECKTLSGKLSKHIVFIDIDNDTYSRWGEPLFIPRSEIAHYLKLADKNKANVVALDILFEYPSYCPSEDAELRRFLEDLPKGTSTLKIIFPTVMSSIDNKIRKNIFDDLIDKNPDRFYRGLPVTSFSRYDRVHRYIHYYDIAKRRDGGNMVLWTVPVLTAVLSAAKFKDDFSKLRALEPTILDDREHQRPERYPIKLSNKTLEIGNNELFSNRIRFAFIPPGTFGGAGNLYLERILPREMDKLQQELEGKVVIIGTSSPDKESWYRTPVGDMPGIYIIGNATNVLMENWQVRDTPPWIAFSVDLLVILFACYMFVHCHPSVAKTIATIFAFVLLMPLTYYFYAKYGIVINAVFLFINIVVPIMVMGLDRIQKNVNKLALAAALKLISRYY
jgi:CHASE2 domain-containing sensor protein